MKRTTSQYIIVKRSSIHSRGVFAKKNIPQGTRIIEYVGDKITKKESDRRADIPISLNKKCKTVGAVYIFELNKRNDIDGFVSYNTARFINHSCSPNCETVILRGHIWIIALRDIKKGEELSYNYGYRYDGSDEHICYCRAHNCVGYILSDDHWPKLKKDLIKKYNVDANLLFPWVKIKNAKTKTRRNRKKAKR